MTADQPIASIWAELGLAPTEDTSLIRQSYAARLKQTRPEDDPAGFTRLRAAYEAALALAPGLAAPPPEPPPPASHHTRPTPRKIVSLRRPPLRAETAARRLARDIAPRPAPAPPEPAAASLSRLPPEAQAAARDIADALDRKANKAAARLLIAACQANLLPFRTEFQLKERLAAALLADRSTPAWRRQEIAEALGLYGEAAASRQDPDSPQARLGALVERERNETRKLQGFIHSRAALSGAGAVGVAGSAVIAYFVIRLVIMPIIVYGLAGWNAASPRDQPIPQRPVAAQPAGTPAPPVSPYLDDLRKRAEAGVASAESDLGAAYVAGRYVPQDYEQALLWLRKAADQGHVPAFRNLAYLLRYGLGAPKDLAAARGYYLKGAEAGDPTSAAALGQMLLAGEGGPVDAKEGFRWTRIAALASSLPAMTGLANLYASGTGTGRDLAKSAAWRLAAASAGDPDAMRAYGLMALKGEGMAPDKAKAYRWLALSVWQQAEDTPERLQLRKILPQPQLDQIDLEVGAWHPILPEPPSIDAR